MLLLRMLVGYYVAACQTVDRFARVYGDTATKGSSMVYDRLRDYHRILVPLVERYGRAAVQRDPREWILNRLQEQRVQGLPPEFATRLQSLLDSIHHTVVFSSTQRSEVRTACSAPIPEHVLLDTASFEAELRSRIARLVEDPFTLSVNGFRIDEWVRMQIGREFHDLQPDQNKVLASIVNEYIRILVRTDLTGVESELVPHASEISRQTARLVQEYLYRLQADPTHEQIRELVIRSAGWFGISENEPHRAERIRQQIQRIRNDIDSVYQNLDRLLLRTWLHSSSETLPAVVSEPHLAKAANVYATVAVRQSPPVPHPAERKPPVLHISGISAVRSPEAEAMGLLHHLAGSRGYEGHKPTVVAKGEHEQALRQAMWWFGRESRPAQLARMEHVSELMGVLQVHKEMELLRGGGVVSAFVQAVSPFFDQPDVPSAPVSPSRYQEIFKAWSDLQAHLRNIGPLRYLNLPYLQVPESSWRLDVAVELGRTLELLVREPEPDSQIAALTLLSDAARRELETYIQGIPTDVPELQQVREAMQALLSASPQEIPGLLERYQHLLDASRKIQSTTFTVWESAPSDDPFARVSASVDVPPLAIYPGRPADELAQRLAAMAAQPIGLQGDLTLRVESVLYEDELPELIRQRIQEQPELLQQSWEAELAESRTRYVYSPQTGFLRVSPLLEEGGVELPPLEVAAALQVARQREVRMQGRLVRRRSGRYHTVSLIGEMEQGTIGDPIPSKRYGLTTERAVQAGRRGARPFSTRTPFVQSVALELQDLGYEIRPVPVILGELQRIDQELAQHAVEAGAHIEAQVAQTVQRQREQVARAIETAQALAQELQALMRGEAGGVISRRTLAPEETSRLYSTVQRLAAQIQGLPYEHRLRRMLSTSVRPQSSMLREVGSRFIDLPVAPRSVYVQRGDVTMEVTSLSVEEGVYLEMMANAQRGQVLEANESLFHELVSRGAVREVVGTPIGLPESDLEILRRAQVTSSLPAAEPVEPRPDVIASADETGVRVARRGRRFSRDPYELVRRYEAIRRRRLARQSAESRIAEQVIQSAVQRQPMVSAPVGQAEVADVLRLRMAYTAAIPDVYTTRLAGGSADLPSNVRRIGLPVSDLDAARQSQERVMSDIRQALRQHLPSLPEGDLEAAAEEIFLGLVYDPVVERFEHYAGRQLQQDQQRLSAVLSRLASSEVSPESATAVMEAALSIVESVTSDLMRDLDAGAPGITVLGALSHLLERTPQRVLRPVEGVSTSPLELPISHLRGSVAREFLSFAAGGAGGTLPSSSPGAPVVRSQSVERTVSLESLAEPRDLEPEGMELETALARASSAAVSESAESAALRGMESRARGLRESGASVVEWFLDPRMPLVSRSMHHISTSRVGRQMELRRLSSLGIPRSELESSPEALELVWGEIYNVANRITDFVIQQRAATQEVQQEFLQQLAELARLRPQEVRSALRDLIFYDIRQRILNEQDSESVPIVTSDLARRLQRTTTSEDPLFHPDLQVGRWYVRHTYVEGIVAGLPSVGLGRPAGTGIEQAIRQYESAKVGGGLQSLMGRQALPVRIRVPGAGETSTYISEIQVGGQLVHALWLNGQWVPIAPGSLQVRSYLSEVRPVRPPAEGSLIRGAATAPLTGGRPEQMVITEQGRVVMPRRRGASRSAMMTTWSQQGWLALDLETTIGTQTPMAFGLVHVTPDQQADVLFHRMVLGGGGMESQASAVLRANLARAQSLSDPSRSPLAQFYPAQAARAEIVEFAEDQAAAAHAARIESIRTLMDILESEHYSRMQILVENKAFDLSALVGYLQEMQQLGEVTSRVRGGAEAVRQLEERVRALFGRVVDPQELLSSVGYRQREGLSRSMSVEARLRRYLEGAAPDPSAVYQLQQVETHVAAMDAYHSAITLEQQLRGLQSARSVGHVGHGTLLYGMSSYLPPGLQPVGPVYLGNNVNTPQGRLFRIVQMVRAGAESDVPGVHQIVLEEVTGGGRRWQVQISSASMLEDLFNRYFMVVHPEVMRARGVNVQTQQEAEQVARQWSEHVVHDRALRKLRTALALGAERETIYMEDEVVERSVRSRLFGAMRTFRRGLGLQRSGYLSLMERVIAADEDQDLVRHYESAWQQFVRTAFGDDQTVLSRAREVFASSEARELLLQAVRTGELPQRDAVHPLLYEFLLDVQYVQRYLTDPMVREQYRRVGAYLGRQELEPVIRTLRQLSSEAVRLVPSEQRFQQIYERWSLVGEHLRERFERDPDLQRLVPPIAVPPHDLGIAIQVQGTRPDRFTRRVVSLTDPQSARATVEWAALTEMTRMERQQLEELLRSVGVGPAGEISTQLSGLSDLSSAASVFGPDSPGFEQAVRRVFTERIALRSFGREVSLDDLFRLVDSVSQVMQTGGDVREAVASVGWLTPEQMEPLVNRLVHGLETTNEFAVVPQIDHEYIGLIESGVSPDILAHVRRYLHLLKENFQGQPTPTELVHLLGRTSESNLLAWLNQLSDPLSRLHPQETVHDQILSVLQRLLPGTPTATDIMDQVRSQAYRMSMYLRTGSPLERDLPTAGWLEAEAQSLIDQMVQGMAHRVESSPQVVVPFVGAALAGIVGAMVYGMIDDSREREEQERRGARIDARPARSTSTVQRDGGDEDEDVEYTIRGGRLSEASMERIRNVVSAGHARRARSQTGVYRLKRWLRQDVRNLAERLIGVD